MYENIKILFCNDKQQKEFAIAVRKNVNKYFKKKGIATKGNLPMMIQSIVMLAVIGSIKSSGHFMKWEKTTFLTPSSLSFYTCRHLLDNQANDHYHT